MIKTKSIKKIAITAISALSLLFVADALNQNVNITKPQIVQASIMQTKETYQKLVDAGWNTPQMSINAKPKIHLYKKAKVKTTWQNQNIALGEDLAYDTVNAGASIIVGYVKLGNRKYYITYNDGGADFLTNSNFEIPTVMHSNHLIHQYAIATHNKQLFVSDETYEVEGGPYVRNFVIPTQHKAIKITDDKGITREVVPVYAVYQKDTSAPGMFATTIEKKDFDQLKKGTLNNKKLTLQGFGKLYQKNGHAVSNYSKTKWFKSNKKDANKMLKSKKKKKKFTKIVKSNINAMKYSVKEDFSD